VEYIENIKDDGLAACSPVLQFLKTCASAGIERDNFAVQDEVPRLRFLRAKAICGKSEV